MKKGHVERNDKLGGMESIIRAVERDRAKGRRLFLYADAKEAVYDYYRSERTARIANKDERMIMGGDGSLLRVETVYPDVEEISLEWILDLLTDHINPFGYIPHSHSEYPYGWMRDMEDLFLSDPNDPHGGWDECLFPKAAESKG